MKGVITVKKHMGLGGIALAFLFFFNPNLHVMDLLPDFIGYILLCRALGQLADLNESIEGAVALFRRMIFIDAGKWLAILWIFGLAAANERSSSMLLWTFVFSVVELIVLIPAYNKLFEGLTQFGYFYSDEAIFGTKEGSRRKSNTDRIRNLTVAFVILKSVLTVLPEFTDLTSTSYDENASAVLNLYQYIGHLRFLAALPIFAVGLIWFFRICAYFRRLRRDTALMNGLRKDYEEKICPKTGRFVRRDFGLACILLLVAVILGLDLRFDQKNLLPDFLSVILFSSFFIVVTRHISIKKARWILPISVYGAACVASAIVEWRFFDEYYYGAIWKSDDALSIYRVILGLDVLKAILFLWVVLTVAAAIFAVISSHTGYVLGRECAGERESQMIEALRKELGATVYLAIVFAVIYAISDVAYSFLVPSFGFMGAINLAFGAVFFIFVCRSLSAIRQAVETKYMLE